MSMFHNVKSSYIRILPMGCKNQLLLFFFSCERAVTTTQSTPGVQLCQNVQPSESDCSFPQCSGTPLALHTQRAICSEIQRRSAPTLTARLSQRFRRCRTAPWFHEHYRRPPRYVSNATGGLFLALHSQSTTGIRKFITETFFLLR